VISTIWWYSLIVVETTTQQNVKQFSVHVRYWSPEAQVQ